ncbi:MFS transporter, partial [Pseudomonas syringae pv. tagetis]
LIGSAALGTFKIVREKFHSSHIVEHLTLIDPLVHARLQSYSASYGWVIADRSLRNSQGMRAMATAARGEANVLAYND